MNFLHRTVTGPQANALGLVTMLVLGAGCGAVSESEPDAAIVDAAPVPEIDAAVCAKDPCDLIDQCGCVAPQVCDLDLDGLAQADTECRDVTAEGREQASCTALDQCAGGYACLGGQCRQYCEDDVVCGLQAFCKLSVGIAGGGQVPGVTACSKRCTPEAQSGNNCPDTFGCHLSLNNAGEPTEFFNTDCFPGGAGTNDVDCSANGRADCAPGFNCVSFSQGGEVIAQRCRQHCRVGGPANCTTNGQVCRQFGGTRPTVEGIEYGFCGVPPALQTQPFSVEPVL